MVRTRPRLRRRQPRGLKVLSNNLVAPDAALPVTGGYSSDMLLAAGLAMFLGGLALRFGQPEPARS